MPLQRDPQGRFVPGTSAGPGRPKKRRDPAYLHLVAAVVRYDDWRAILERLKAVARTGDPAACKFLAGYLLGRPGLADPPEDETEDATALPAPLAASPSQFSLAMIREMDQQLEQQKRRADEAAEQRMTNSSPGRSVTNGSTNWSCGVA